MRMDARSAAALNPNYGKGTHTIEEGDFVDPDEILAYLRARFGSPQYRPPVLPAVAMQVHNLTRRNDTSISEVVALVRRDPFLAADVLRRAQSPMFATKAPPRTLEDAASRLGMNGVRDLVFEVALNGRIFRAKGFEEPMDAVRKHCLLVAYCTQAVAQMTRTSEDTAFLAGLLHDVGMLAALHALAEGAQGKTVDLALASSALREVHVEAGVIVVRAWSLPQEIEAMVAAHHHPQIGTTVNPLAACVVTAEAIAVSLAGPAKAGPIDLGGQAPAALSVAQRALHLDDHNLARLTEHLRKTLGGAK
ncbi:MAG: HDOD domain-containing protein [Sandaracinaceae bacterium]|nr:HDOD domain-containing protein [Sandaracinaceae bacterium]